MGKQRQLNAKNDAIGVKATRIYQAQFETNKFIIEIRYASKICLNNN